MEQDHKTSDEKDMKPTWGLVLRGNSIPERLESIKQILIKERSQYNIYPHPDNIFNALKLTPLNDVKVVIIGQDPYHGPGQAMGLSFSVNDGIKVPPSLQNIYKELKDDLGLSISESGNLTSWAKQGVLLLNSTLTVRERQPNSHSQIGWEYITEHIIKGIVEHNKGVVFLLWGKFAQNYSQFITTDHHILMSAHPSPFSANRGFFGCKHFSKTNELLKLQNKTSIDWQIL